MIERMLSPAFAVPAVAALLLVLVLINYRLRAHPLAAHSRESADLAATRFAPLGK